MKEFAISRSIELTYENLWNEQLYIREYMCLREIRLWECRYLLKYVDHYSNDEGSYIITEFCNGFNLFVVI